MQKKKKKKKQGEREKKIEKKHSRNLIIQKLNTTKCILDYWGGMLNTEEIKDN